MIGHDNPATLRLMRALLPSGETGASREQLVHDADIATTTFYRVVRPLLSDGLVKEQGDRYVLSLTHPYNYRFKVWHDMERLYRLSPRDRDAVLDVLEQAKAKLGDDLLALWLVGSAAHDTLTARSDFDFLAIRKKDKTFVPTSIRELNFVTMTPATLGTAIEQQDPFVVAALRYGILLHDREFAQPYFVRLPALRATPVSGQRDETVTRLGDRFLMYLGEKDVEEASGVLRSIGVQTARLMLGAFGELPASKSDLLQAARLYLGDGFAKLLDTVMVYDKADTMEMIHLRRHLDDYLTLFQAEATHLASFARILQSQASLEAELPTFLREIFPGHELAYMTHHFGRGRRPQLGILVHEGDHVRCVFECRVILRAIKLEEVEGAPEHSDHTERVLVVSQFRELHPLKRPALPPKLVKKAHAKHVHLLDSADVVRAHAALHLDKRSPRKVRSQLGL